MDVSSSSFIFTHTKNVNLKCVSSISVWETDSPDKNHTVSPLSPTPPPYAVIIITAKADDGYVSVRSVTLVPLCVKRTIENEKKLLLVVSGARWKEIGREERERERESLMKEKKKKE